MEGRKIVNNEVGIIWKQPLRILNCYPSISLEEKRIVSLLNQEIGILGLRYLFKCDRCHQVIYN